MQSLEFTYICLVGCSPWGHEESDTYWATSLSIFTFHFHALEKEMATHSSVLAWRIPGMVEPGGLPSEGSHRVGQKWSDLAAAAAKYRGMETCRYTFCYKRKLNTVNFLNINLNLAKLKPYIHRCPYSQSYVFFSNHVWMWELDHKENWASKNFEPWHWRRL